MITYNAIGDLLRARLTEMAPRPPIVWENQELSGVNFPKPPFLTTQIIRMDPDRRTLSDQNGSFILNGIFQVTVVAGENTFASEAERLADRVAAYFPSGLRLGPVLVRTRPTVQGGYSNPPYWRLPVLINWRVLDKSGA